MKRKILPVIVMIGALITSLFGLFGCQVGHDYYSRIRAPYAAGVYDFENGYGTTNMGYAKAGTDEDPLKNVDRLTAVVPNTRQLAFLELEYYNFIHFGMNTFTGKEWGTGKEDPALFHPKKLDTDQWCEALKASGSKGIILTAKHHDGFCLWQTDTTEHSVKNSPWKNGKGDVVAELAASCKKYGLKMGLYLSPWDMNAASYGTNEYNDFFVAQLTELCTRYGEVFTFWFDGARGAEVPEDFVYDKARWFSVIKELQPNAVTAIQGEDVRWIGNEAGVSRENEWSVIGRDSSKYQESEDDAGRLLESYELPDLGSREALAAFGEGELRFYPAEVDVSIRKGWFYHKNQRPKSLKHLLEIYFKAVGGNGSLLLNVPPDKNGLIDNKDVRRLKELGDAVAATQKTVLTPASYAVGGYANGVATADAGLSVLSSEYNDAFYRLKDDRYIIDFHFGKTVSLGRIDLREELAYSQRVEKFELWAKKENGWTLVGQEGVIGNRRTILLEKAVETETVRLIIKQSRNDPHLRSVVFYEK